MGARDVQTPRVLLLLACALPIAALSGCVGGGDAPAAGVATPGALDGPAPTKEAIPTKDIAPTKAAAPTKEAAPAATKGGALQQVHAEAPASWMPSVRVAVDPALAQASKAPSTYAEDGAMRPVARLAVGDVAADLVEDELILCGAPEAAAALAKSANAVALATRDPSTLVGKRPAEDGEPLPKGEEPPVGAVEVAPEASGLELAPCEVLRVAPAPADRAALERHLSALAPGVKGEVRASSERALDLLALAARLAVEGHAVGLNWILVGSEHFDTTTEAAGGRAEFSYQPNSTLWPHIRSNSSQAIGVLDAWRALEAAGRLDRRVSLSILDMGFGVDPDLPSGTIASCNNAEHVCGGDARTHENAMRCTGGNPCPWHGGMAASSAMSMPDNGIGAAGPAGPVARPVLIYTYYDIVSAMTAIERASRVSRIASMSFGASIDAILTWSLEPFNRYTAAASAGGTLLVAAAGNDGADVDGLVCPGCAERTWTTPCENDGVLCVGGLLFDADMRDPGSNVGSRGSVDIFGPYVLHASADPASRLTTGENATLGSGTSAAAPFVAGVAGLVLAAEPRLSGAQVEALLVATARASADAVVSRVVNASAAVERALGESELAVRILAPAEGARLVAGESVVLRAGWSTPGAARVAWTLDGAPLGMGATLATRAIPHGRHTLGMTLTDARDRVASASITVDVANDAPTIWIDPTVAARRYEADVAIRLRASSSDRNEHATAFRLPDANVRWHAVELGRDLGTGHEPEVSLPAGVHTIVVRGTDAAGLVAQDSVVITVAAPRDASGYTLEIVEPTARRVAATGTGEHTLRLAGRLTHLGRDASADAGWTFAWTDTVGGAVVQRASGLAASMRVREPDCFATTTHVLTLEATRSGAPPIRESVAVVFEPAPC